jgi:hypothetical protein
VEIGSESGKTTRRLVDLARGRGGVVHAVDPAPGFDADLAVRELAPHLVFHGKKSLDALPEIDRMDAVLVDGDHNWFTVHAELCLIERLAIERGHTPPLILLHDIAWPYGRRDLYYDPDAIPAEHRQPFAKRGISPTSSELAAEGGYNAHLCNALHEGGPKNGVLTAVEDWLAGTSLEAVFAKIPAVFGLGIVLPTLRADARPDLARRVAAWTVPEVERFIDRLETARIAMLTGVRA